MKNISIITALRKGILYFRSSMIVIFLLSSFNNANSQNTEQLIPQFGTILDSLQVKGSILIFDSNENIYYSNDFNWSKKKFLPASTFKIPNSIIALELGIIKDEKSILKWDGKKRRVKIWEEDLSLKEAFQYSCVPCFQEIAIKIGLKNMKNYLNKLNYNGMSFDEKTLTNFWLQGSSKISQKEQIVFLKNFYFSKLPISQKTEQTVKNILKIEKNDNYTLSAKTGWASTKNKNIGWYVGFIETKDNTYFFATNIIPKKETDLKTFLEARIHTTKKAIDTLIFNL